MKRESLPQSPIEESKARASDVEEAKRQLSAEDESRLVQEPKIFNPN